MSTTITMNVTEARRRLGNTRALSSEQIDEAQRVVNAFHASKPRKQCVCCGSMIWSDHSGAWACDRCHRGADVTVEEWHAAETARQKAADASLKATVAAAPDPRVVLKEQLAALATARGELAKLERAVPVARSRVWDLQARVEAAEAAASEANEGAAANLAEAIAEGKSVGPSSAGAKARAALADAIDALSVAKSARAIVEERLSSAKSQVDFTFDKAKKAVRWVISAERLEDLLTSATEARAEYIDALGQLAWLVREHALPNDDRRAHQLVADGNTPPSAWQESATAGIQVMQAAFDALMLDAAAVI